MRKAIIPAFLLVVVSLILGATVFREPIASAAQATAATIVGPLDANGNVKVHEQGTANVAISNSGNAVKAGDQTQVLFSGVLPDGGLDLDVSSAREIRVLYHCSVGTAILDIFSSDVRMDQLNASCPDFATGTYEVPGTSLHIARGPGDGGGTIALRVFGRSN